MRVSPPTKNLLWFNLAADEADPVLGFTTSWIREMAKLVSHISVVTMRCGRVGLLPSNVDLFSLGKEKGATEPRRAMTFYRVVSQILRRRAIQACFCHMTPVFAIMAAPLLKLYRVPIITWYAHRQVTRRLRLADRLSSKVVSVNAYSYPLISDKLVEIGHGIDTRFYSPDPGVERCQWDILVVSRISPIKDPNCLLSVIPELRKTGLPVRCVLIGSAPDRDREFEKTLRDRIARRGLSDFVHFPGPAKASEVVDWFHRCGVHINLAPSDHSVDKAPLEAMASGLVSFSSATSLKDTFGRYRHLLHFEESNPEDLRRKLLSYFRLSCSRKEQMASYLRERVREMHGLESLTRRLISVFDSCLRSQEGESL